MHKRVGTQLELDNERARQGLGQRARRRRARPERVLAKVWRRAYFSLGTTAAQRTAMKRLPLDQHALAELCRRRGIRRLSLFGSVLKGKDRPDSDVDFLVEFQPSAKPSYLDLADIEQELSSMLAGRRVDLRTAPELSKYFRDQVIREAEVQYDAR